MTDIMPKQDPGATPPPADEAAADEAVAEHAAARPLDTIGLPLLAPLARLFGGLDPEIWEPGEYERVTADLDLLDADPGLASPASRAAVMRAGEFARAEGSDLYRIVTDEWLALDPDQAPLVQARAFREWMKETEPHVALAALAAASVAADHPADVATRTSRDLFHYARAHGAGSWGDAHRAAHAYWADPSNRERFLLRAWVASRVDAEMLEGIIAQVTAEKEALKVALRRPPLTPPPPSPSLMLVQRQDAPDRVAELRRELGVVRAAGSKARARAIELEKEAGPLRAERDQAVRNAKMLRALLAEARGSGHAAPPEPAEPADDAWPGDLLAGCTIALFTGQTRTAAREAMAEQLRLVGAELSVYDGNAKSAGPERFQPGTIVVCDVRFMSHASSDRIRDRAARSGVRCIERGNGQGGLVRAVAGALGRGR